MYEESESERYRDKLKREYEEFVRNHDVYQTLTKFNKDTYGNIIETAILVFQCNAEDLDMDQLKAMEEFLKISKNKYHALVAIQEDEENNIEISDEEEPEPIKHPEVEEIKYHMPRVIPPVPNNICEIPHNQQWNNRYPHQNVMLPPWNSWRNPAPNFGITVYNMPQNNLKFSPPPIPQFDAIRRLGSSHELNQINPLPQQVQFPQFSQIRPTTSRQMIPEKPVPFTYREHRLMKQQEEQRLKTEQEKKQQDLQMKKKMEESQELERNRQKELQQNQNRNRLSNYKIRKQQIDDYKKREIDEQASTSSKQNEPFKSALKAIGSEKDNKKTVKWNEDANRCLTYNRDLNGSISNSCDKSVNFKCVDELPSILKFKNSCENDKSSTEKTKPSNKAAIPEKSNSQKGNKKAEVSAKSKEKDLKSTEKATVSTKSNKIKKLVTKESDLKKAAPKKDSKTVKSVPVLTPGKTKDDKTENQKAERKIGKIKKIHSIKPIKLMKGVDCLSKRKSESPVKDVNQPKRLKEKTNETQSKSGTSNCDKQAQEVIENTNIVIKEEKMSDDENLDGKTVVSSNNDNIIEPENVQRMESDHIRIKQENDLNINDSTSTIEQIDIKEEVISTIDQENSSIHSGKMDVNQIAENFIKVCENPDFLDQVEKLIDFSEYEDLTEDAVNNNNKNEVIIIDSQEKCETWLEQIDISNFDRTTESPNYDVQFYATKDEEVEPDDDIVPYFPVRQLGAPEIIPKEEEK